MKVLLVAAPGATRQRFEEFFHSRRHEVVACSGSAAARDQLGSNTFRYVLLDLGVDAAALDLCRHLHECAEGDGTYVLAIPAAPTIEAIRDALAAGADDYLTHPVELAALQLRLAIGDRRLAVRQQRNDATRRLEHSERRLRTVLETMHEGLFQLDANGLIEYANSRLSSITGYSLNELLGESADELLVEAEVRDRLPEQTLLGAGTGSEEYSIPLRTKAGTQKWVKLTGAPLPALDGGPGGAFGVIEDVTEQRNAEEELRFREQYFRALFENSSDLITILDVDGGILYQSSSSQALLGWSAEELIGQSMIDYVHPDDRQSFSDTLQTASDSSATTTAAQLRLRNRNEQWRNFEALCTNLITNPVVGGLVVTSRDITEHRRIEAELNRERALFQQLFRNSPAGIVIVDNDDRVVDTNRSFEDLFQFSLAEIKGKPLNDFIVSKEMLAEATELSQAIFNRQAVGHESVRRRKDGSHVDVAIIGYPIVVSDRQIGAFAIYSDITERKNAERQLFHDAFHDSLTGLPNRSLLTERLERALRRSRRLREYQFALLFIDLDQFKEINDTLGHKAGDQLLAETAKRLNNCLRPGDTVARLGGDEFTIILEDLQHMSDATRIAERILELLSRSFVISGKEVQNSCSIGIAFSATGYKSVDELIRDADMAMYRAKTHGKGRYEVFDTKMHKSAVERLQLERELKRAIEQQELVLHYQPVVSLTTGKVFGFEALVRWSHPKRGLIGPDRLISICEEIGLIVPLGRWVLRKACWQVAAWQERFPESDATLVTVNLSPGEISHPNFLPTLDQIAKSTGVSRPSIGLEIPESLVVKQEESLTNLLWELHRRGFRLYIHDFGVGSSSLSALHRFPIDALKIDRSFIHSITPGGEHLEIVRTIGAIGESQGCSVIAVGVETDDQLAHVRKLELPFAQGYFFARPLAAEQAEKLIAGKKRWPLAAPPTPREEEG